MSTGLLGLFAVAGWSAGQVTSDVDLPLLVVRADDTQVASSCRVVIPAGLVIPDVGGDGVLQVVADDVRLVFQGDAVLRGAPEETAGDRRSGVGIAVVGRHGVTVEGARIEGFRVGVLAREADDLVLRGVSVQDGFRQRLISTAAVAADSVDWLAPHDNDAAQWVTTYGAALCVERSARVTVHGGMARRTQNGLILDRVVGARVFDNDFSWLSGWGIALWRVERSSITRNALDYCIRGYSHGVYNRGQDSAGLLMFEQCHDNFVAENSITHGGDGIFAFSGREALGEGGRDLGQGAHEGLGHHGNWFVDNDLSFAAAHGLELTFAGSNVIRGNRFEGNAICGLWGGYSRGLWILENRFERNGDAGYGLERGAVNIEHGAHVAVLRNRFEHNRCGVHFWWDEDPHIKNLPWARDNGVACRDNLVADNLFRGDELGVQLRSCGSTVVEDNRWEDVGRKVDVQEGASVEPDDDDRREVARAGVGTEPVRPAWMEVLGESRPVHARSGLRGRQHILMTPWGPWDGESVAWHALEARPGAMAWRLLGAPDALDGLAADAAGPGVSVTVDGETLRIGPRAGTGPADGLGGVFPWRLALPGVPLLEGTLVTARWRVTCFPSPCDPRDDRKAWRAGASGVGAVSFECDSLDLPYGSAGPAELGLITGTAEELEPRFPVDHFGTRAETALQLPAGRWRLATLSDDGVTVSVDGVPLIDDWSWHAPTPHEAVFDLEEARKVHIAVEHFELDGWSVLRVELEPLGTVVR